MSSLSDNLYFYSYTEHYSAYFYDAVHVNFNPCDALSSMQSIPKDEYDILDFWIIFPFLMWQNGEVSYWWLLFYIVELLF